MKKTEKENKRTNYFYCSDFIFDCDLSVQAKLVYVFLRRCANADGECYPGYQYICKKCHISKKTAIKAVKDLIKMNLISKESRKIGKKTSSNLYKINLDWEPTEDAEIELFEQIEVTQEHPPSISGTLGVVSQVNPPSISDTLGVVSQVHPPSISGALREVYQEHPGSIPENLEGIHNISTTHNKDNANYVNTDYKIPPPNNNHEEHSNVSLVDEEEDDNKDILLKELKDRIEYDILAEEHENINLLDQIVHIMLDVFVTPKDRIKIGGEYVDTLAIKKEYSKITGYEIQYVMDVFLNCEIEIKNINAYLKTVLSKAPLNADAYYYNKAKAAEI